MAKKISQRRRIQLWYENKYQSAHAAALPAATGFCTFRIRRGQREITLGAGIWASCAIMIRRKPGEKLALAARVDGIFSIGSGCLIKGS